MKLALYFIILSLQFSAFCANCSYFDQYHEDVIDRCSISVSFIGMTLTPKYLKKGCVDPSLSPPKGCPSPESGDGKQSACNDCGIQTLALNANEGGRSVMTSKMLTERFAPGVYISYMNHIDPYTSLNVVFQGLVKWHSQMYARGLCVIDPAVIQIPFGPLTHCNLSSNWNNADLAHFRYDTELNSISLNVLTHSTPVFLDYFTISGYGGLRYILFSETLRIEAHAPPDISCYHVTTDNNLIGLQIGSRFAYASSRTFTWVFDIKGGVFANLVQAHPQLFDHNNTVELFNEEVGVRTLSYLAEMHPYVLFNIADNFFIETAFQSLVIWNLSLARKFVTFTRDQTNVFTRSYRYYNSFQFGVGFRF